MPAALRLGVRSVLDGLAFTGAIPAAVAAALVAAAETGLGQPIDPVATGLAASGTFFVYGVDRLRGAGDDRARSPDRTRFVEAHRTALLALTGAAGVVAALLVVESARTVQLLCAAVAAAGLLHRRLKHFPVAKPLYVAAAWVAVTAGIPALASPGAEGNPWVLAVYGAAIGANLLASNTSPRPGLALAALGTAVALLAPRPLPPLAVIPALQLAVLLRYRDSERYRLIALDGALLMGAALALVWIR